MSKVSVLLHLIRASMNEKSRIARPNQNFKVFGNGFPPMLHEFGGNQKFFYQNKVHNFSFLLFKALRFFPLVCWLLFRSLLFRPLHNVDFSGGCMHEWLLFAYRKTFCLLKPSPIYLIFQSKLLKQIKKFSKWTLHKHTQRVCIHTFMYSHSTANKSGREREKTPASGKEVEEKQWKCWSCLKLISNRCFTTKVLPLTIIMTYRNGKLCAALHATPHFASTSPTIPRQHQQQQPNAGWFALSLSPCVCVSLHSWIISISFFIPANVLTRSRPHFIRIDFLI